MVKYKLVMERLAMVTVHMLVKILSLWAAMQQRVGTFLVLTVGHGHLILETSTPTTPKWNSRD